MTILMNNLKRIFGKKVNIICMIVVPIALSIFMISATTGEVKYTIGIYDEDKTQFTEEFIELLKKTCVVEKLSDKDDINKLVINGDVDCTLVFEDGFTNKMISGEDVYVKNYAMDNTNETEPIQMYIDSYISAAKEIGKAAKGDEEAFYNGMEDYLKNEYAVEYKNFESSSLEDVDRSVTALGYMAFGMVLFVSFSTMIILEDKTSGVYDRISTTPLKRSSYFIQNILSYFIVALIQIMLILNILPEIMDISFGASKMATEIQLACCAFAIACISIGITVSRFSKNAVVSGAITTFIDMPILMLGGCLWPREIMPEALQKIGDFLPTTWFLKASETILYGDGLAAAGSEMLYMLLFAAVLLFVSFGIKTEKAR